MTADPIKPAAEQTYDQRKKILIAQGAARRNEIDRSIDIVRDNLHADKLAKNAVNHLTSVAYSSVENLFDWQGLRNGNFKKLLPLAATAYSIITRRKLVVPILRGAAVVAGVSAGAYMLWRHRRRVGAVAQAEMLSHPDYVDPGV